MIPMFCAANYFSSLGSEKSSVPRQTKGVASDSSSETDCAIGLSQFFVSCRKDADTRRSLGSEPYLFHPWVSGTMPLLYSDVVELPNSDRREILRMVLGHGSI